MYNKSVRFAGLLPVLAFAAACSSGGGGSSPVPAPSFTSIPGSSTLASTGVAYLPDGGSGHGVQAVHFEDVGGNLLSSPSSGAAPTFMAFPASVGPLALASDASTALSADSAGSGAPFTQLQDVFGMNVANLTPAGTPYAVTTAPSPTPSVTPTISDVTGLAVLGTGSSSIGLAVGLNSNGILGVTSLVNAPPQYGSLVPFTDPSFSVQPPAGPRYNIRVSSDSSEALVRGSDLIAFTVKSVATGFQLNASAYSSTLGTHPTTLRGAGGMAIDPASNGSALLAQAPGSNDVTLINGLPGAINTVGSVTLGSRPHAIAWAPNGQSAAIGADGGYYLLSGLPSALTLISSTPANPTFTGCDGNPHTFVSVTSIAISLDSRYLVLYGPSDATTCAGGANGTLVAIPYVTSGATPAPSSSMFVQNELNLPAAISGGTASSDQDYMVVR